MWSPLLLLLASALSLDGEGALRHASALAALGPHPFGSPRGRFAGEYVAAQLRSAGLDEVRLLDFEAREGRGANVLGVLRASSPELILLAAHHDTVQDSPGAYASGGGAGLLIEAARALARRGDRKRTLVFASFDGREPVLQGKGGLGARAYVRSLGRQARELVAVLVLDRAGRKGGTPLLETLALPDPLRPGAVLVAPRFLVEAALAGSKAAGEALSVGDPRVPWLYQAGVRAFRATGSGDERPFLEAGLAALRLSDNGFLAVDQGRLAPDTSDGLEVATLARLGRATLGTLLVVEGAPRGAADEPDWFVGLGRLLGRPTLLALSALSLAPALRFGRRAPLARLVRLVHALLFAFLAWRQPVVCAFIFLLPNLLFSFARRLPWLVLGLAPAASLLGFGVLAWSRGLVHGALAAPWELALAGFTLALTLLRPRSGGAPAGRGPRAKKGLPRP